MSTTTTTAAVPHSSQNPQDIITEFKRLLIGFIDELIEQFPQEGDLVLARVFLNNQVPITVVINYFIKELLPLKPIIEQRDENFFLQNDILFGAINRGKVGHFRRLWRSPVLDDTDRALIWKWFDYFIRITERYQQHIIMGSVSSTKKASPA